MQKRFVNLVEKFAIQGGIPEKSSILKKDIVMGIILGTTRKS